MVVDRAWLERQMGRPGLVVADVRWYLDGRSGAAAYEAGHVPGAVFVDLDRDLSAPTKGGAAGRHPLPSTASFATRMGALGIGDGVVVVAYDDAGGTVAGRLVWMLQACGQAAALLDGGLAAWGESGGDDCETGPPPLPAEPPARLTVPPDWPRARLAGADELLAGPAVVVDARSPERYRGEVEPVDARPGHVPGARNAPSTANVDGSGRFRAPADLRRHYGALGIDEGSDVIAYCGSGVSACLNLLALEHAGLGPGRLFVPSWSGWAADPTRPAATGG